jgi:hypothetical protein
MDLPDHARSARVGKLRVLACLAFGAALVVAAQLSPSSRRMGQLSDAVFFPGMLVGSIFAPEGIHSGRGGTIAVFYLATMYVGSVIVWATCAYAVLSVLAKARKRANTP